jgi:iron complex transport system ATP-binding protein
MPWALRLSGVGLVRDDVTILDGVDWEVAPHERWIVLGPNGSGKTT